MTAAPNKKKIGVSHIPSAAFLFIIVPLSKNQRVSHVKHNIPKTYHPNVCLQIDNNRHN